MADWIAVWGAATGTAGAVGAAIAIRREVLANRSRLGIEHGVWYLVRDDPPDLREAWLTIRVWNDGGQPLTIERVGLDLVPMWREGEGDNELLVIGDQGCRVEIELGGEQVELRPGGPSRKIFAPLLALIQARIDVRVSPAIPWVMTTNQMRWEGAAHPVVPDRVPEPFREAVEGVLAAQGAGPPIGVYVGLPSEGPPSEGGVIYG